MESTTGPLTSKDNSPLNNPSSLLGLPDGVENLLLSFVCSGNGGLQSLLNLRAVCKTTQSWVDNLPKRQAGVIFSNAEVRIRRTDIVNSARRFLDSPPPFGVTALSIGDNHLYRFTELSPEDWELWTRFYAFWSPKVESLELRKETLIFDSTHPSLREHFYSQLEGMPKLRKLTVPLVDVTDFTIIRKLIDFKFENSELPLQIHLTLRVDERGLNAMNGSDPFGTVNIGERDRSQEELRNFAASVMSSNSKVNIQLQLDRYGIFEKLKAFFPDEVFFDLCKIIVSIEHLQPTRDLLNLKEIFPKLRNLECMEVPSSVDLQQLTFPASLEELGIVGLPPCHRLPAALISLSLSDFRCNVRTLRSSLMSLNESCPSLKTLNISWDFRKSPEPLVGNVANSPGFSSLKSLVFTGDLKKRSNTAAGRRAILDGFQWDQMKLRYLALSFSDIYDSELRVVGEKLLRKILKGPMAKTLLRVGMRDDLVTREGLPLLQKLRSLAAENSKRREAKEGGGKWTKHSFPEEVESRLERRVNLSFRIVYI